MTLIIDPIPAFNDNYIWLITTEGSSDAFVVDPGDANPVLDALESRGLTLRGILITHHHPDHIGGVTTLKARTSCVVWGPDNPSISDIDHRLSDDDTVDVHGETLTVVTVPGHTLDHIAYVAPGAVFCGDTLFAGGCGRVFEGTFPMMRASLERLRGLDGDTRVYCAHEYTQSNLRFAQAVEPNNQALADRVRHCSELRANDRPTVPSTLAEEWASNPFLRWDAPTLVAALSTAGKIDDDAPDTVFAALRQWKDSF